MLTLARTAVGVFWALWFGGIMSVFIFAVALFGALGRETAAIATGVMFPAFERYSLVLAALVLAATVAWRAVSRSRAATWAFCFFAAATIAAVVSAAVITPRILHLRAVGETHTPEFARAHGISGVIYVVEAIALLAAGIMFLAGGRAAPKAEASVTP